MIGLEIALFILATAFVVISFFIVDNKEKSVAERTQDALGADTFEQMRTGLLADAGKKADLIFHETEDKLETLSNDKIMAVGEYSDQILEKINGNHEEVVFLYKMLNEKEEELKATVQKIDNARVECEKMLLDMNEQKEKQDKNYAFPQNDIPSDVPATSGIAMLEARSAANTTVKSGRQTQTSEKTKKTEAGVKATKKKTVKQPKPVVEDASEPDSDHIDTGMLGRNDRIIALYRDHKSVMEISKLLGMGQGEVRLIIDLYCK